MSRILRFAADESGATAIEYGLIAAIIGLGLIASLRGIVTSHDLMMQHVRENLVVN